MNSHIPLNVNFFCGDWRIAIVTRRREILAIIRTASDKRIITESYVGVRRLDSGWRACWRRSRLFWNFLVTFRCFAVLSDFAWKRRRRLRLGGAEFHSARQRMHLEFNFFILRTHLLGSQIFHLMAISCLRTTSHNQRPVPHTTEATVQMLAFYSNQNICRSSGGNCV